MAMSSEVLTVAHEASTPAATGDGWAMRVHGIGKAYQRYGSAFDLLRELALGQSLHEKHWALRDITFDVPRGTVVGVIGPNGSGKSTLLKIIAGLLDATTGSVEVKGRVSAILELGTGFHPEFTGRENIITGGMCLGMSREEIQAKAQWIIEFSELGSVIDQPFRTYSSGMQARLTFATAISIDPEIFIVDEALAAGDAYFVAKCMKRIRHICNSGATVLMVSHGTNQIAQMCHQAVWLDKGRLRAIGPAREVTKEYDYEVHVRISSNVGQIVEVELEPAATTPAAVPASPDVVPIQAAGTPGRDEASAFPAGNADPAGEVGSADAGPPPGRVPAPDARETAMPPEAALHQTARQVVKVYRKGPIVIDRVVLRDAAGNPTRVFRTWDHWQLDVEYHCDGEIPEETLGLAMTIERESDLVRIAQFNTVNPAGNEMISYDQAPFRRIAGRRGCISAIVPNLQMLEGEFLLSLALQPNVPGLNDYYEYHQRLHRFQVIPAAYPSGAAFYPLVQWRHETEIRSH